MSIVAEPGAIQVQGGSSMVRTTVSVPSVTKSKNTLRFTSTESSPAGIVTELGSGL